MGDQRRRPRWLEVVETNRELYGMTDSVELTAFKYQRCDKNGRLAHSIFLELVEPLGPRVAKPKPPSKVRRDAQRSADRWEKRKRAMRADPRPDQTVQRVNQGSGSSDRLEIPKSGDAPISQPVLVHASANSQGQPAGGRLSGRSEVGVAISVPSAPTVSAAPVGKDSAPVRTISKDNSSVLVGGAIGKAGASGSSVSASSEEKYAALLVPRKDKRQKLPRSTVSLGVRR